MEFKAFSADYYYDAITDGKIRVNDKKVDIDYSIREGDKIVHETVRHETPVTAGLPEIVHEDDEFVAFNKPSSVPVHACGNFMYNTLLKLTELELGYPDLKTVHRLDRQTSGIVFFAKIAQSSNQFREAMLANEISKVYYARVKGDFSKACQDANPSPSSPKNNEEETKEPATEKVAEKQKLTVSCDLHVYCVSNVEALWNCAKECDVPFEHKPKAKSAETLFEFIFYDPVADQSVIKCYPKTGRTH